MFVSVMGHVSVLFNWRYASSK